MSARTYYMLSRVVSGKLAEALAMAPALRTQNEGGFQDPSAFYEVAHSGHRKELVQFLRAVLEKWPDMPLWQSYSQYALEAGQGDSVAQLCRQMLQRKGITPATAMQIGQLLGVEMLAYGTVSNFGIRTESTEAVVYQQKEQVAESTVDVRLIHVKTGEVIYMGEGRGQAYREVRGSFGLGGRMSYDETLAGDSLRASIAKFVDNLIDAAP